MSFSCRTRVAVFLILAAAVPLALANDDAIFDLVRQKLYNDPDVKGANLTISVKNGVVTLEGRVSSEKYKTKAEKLTRKVQGVKDVVNNLRVGADVPR